MCQLLFLAADAPLRLVPFDEKAGAFHVRELTPDEEPVRARFTRKHVVYAGGSEGCACSFGDEYQTLEFSDAESLDLKRKDLAALRGYLETELERQGTLELYATCEEDYARPAAWRGGISPAEMTGDDFRFADGEQLEVRPWGGVREWEEAEPEE